MKKLFFVIVFLAFLIRFIGVDSIPPGINRDEASIGYTAYSILKTGRDEYGRLFPLSFQSFGDWKLPLYIYASIPFIAAFGLSEVTIRLLSILSGTGTVLLIYFLVKKIFDLEIQTRIHTNFVLHTSDFSEKTALLSAFFLSISPWHIHFSRVAYEANVAVFLVTLATVLLLRSFRKPTLLIQSFLFYALSLYTYHGNHIFTPLFLIGLILLFWVNLRSNKYFFISCMVFLLLAGIIFKATLFEANTTKLSGIGLFGDPTTIHTKIELPRLEHNNQLLFTKLIHNKYTYIGQTFINNYLNTFSPDFLFIKGGGNRAHNIPNMGNMYLIDAPFLLLGITYLLRYYKSRWAQLLLLWLFVSPIAPSITKDAPHSARMLSIIPALVITTALGLNLIINRIQIINLKYALFIIISIFYVLSAINYYDKYTVHFPASEWKYWGIQYKVLTEYINTLSTAPKQIIIDKPDTSPYIFMLFYTSYDPNKFQNEVSRYPMTSDGFLHVRSYGIFEFRTPLLDKDQSPNTLLIFNSDEIQSNLKESYKPIYSSKLPVPLLYVSH